ncbi:MAG: aminodeoxychorismate lyase [Pseudomonadota bacterium]
MTTDRLVNGVPAENISIDDRGLQYGDGVFETIALKDGQLFCLTEHLERLAISCVRLNIPFHDLSVLKNECETIIGGHEQAVLKIIITRGEGGRGYAPPANPSPNRIISIYPWPKYSIDNYEQGVSTIFCKTRYGINPGLAGIKHMNRLEQVMARAECTEAAVDEGIVLDTNDNVIEGTMTNLFLVAKGKLITPDLSQCGVFGVIRQKIIDHYPDVSVQTVTRKQLLSAQEIFLCNSLVGVWPVTKIDEHDFRISTVSSEVTKLLKRQGYII